MGSQPITIKQYQGFRTDRLGRTEAARSLYQQALAILEPKLGAEHPWTVRCRENLGKLGEGNRE